MLAGRPGWAQPAPSPSPAPAPVAASCYEARFLDVGQGDAAIVRAGNGPSMLVDAGPRAAGARVVAALRANGGAPDVVVFTHAHADHVGGYRAVLDAFRASRILESAIPFGSALYRGFLRVLADQGRTLSKTRAGQRFGLGPRVSVEVLGPEEPLLSRTRSDANSNSVILRITCGRVSTLLAGDAERPTERRLVARAGLASEVLKVAHHGSRYASSPQFLAAVHPRIAVISCSRANRYGHPAARTIAALRRVGAAVYRTDLQGDVIVRTDGERVEATTSRP